MKALLTSVMAVASKVFQSDWIKYVFELFVVFLGVYLAFLFTDFQEASRERDIRVQHYESLVLELQVLVQSLRVEEEKLIAHMKVVDDIAQGKRPKIPPSNLLFVYPGSLRDAAFNSRHFEALDSEIVNQIIQGSRGLQWLEKSIESFNDKSHALLPLLANEEDCCYGEDGQLLDHWQWYPQLVQEIHQMIQIASIGIVERAIPDLQENIGRMRRLPPLEPTSAIES